ncbi:MAG: 50S ribosomal protein L11 methyltransferase [Lentisphaerae bacterium]|nr:MAG: 50S ribosomal protein L11 methyltransferase [Lentisphaerota bacterium]
MNDSKRPYSTYLPQERYIWQLALTGQERSLGILWELLEAIGIESTLVTPRVAQQKAFLALYLPSEREAQAMQQRLHELLESWSDMLDDEITIELARLENREWQESWKDFFHAEQVSPHLAVRPSWEDVRFPPEIRVISLDPGLSFGTGKHGTTRACLAFIDKIISERGPLPVLDVGCGSGILSIGAALLGCHPVVLFDFDPQAMIAVRENFACNGLDDYFLFMADAGRIPLAQTFPLVCANLETPIIEACYPSIIKTVAAGGYLIVSGILHPESNRVISLFRDHGFSLADQTRIDEWWTGLFRL